MNTGRNGDAPPSYDAIFGSPPGGPVGNISVHARGSVNGNGSSTGGWTAWAQQHEDPSDTPRTSYQPSQPVHQESYRPSTPQMPEENSYDGPSAAVPNWQEKEEEAELQMWFATVDEDNDGRITVQESQQALLNDNYTPFSTETIHMMLKMFDRNSNNTIEYAEFRELKRYIRKWRAVFDHFDKDHSGTIDVDEIQEAFVGMGYNLSADFCKKLCSRFGKKSSSKMNLDAFIYACASIKTMHKDYTRDSIRHRKTFEETLLKWLK